jgi:hypothetical protein
MKQFRAIVALMVGCLCLSAIIGCSQPTPEELASLAAKGYYDHLIRGEYEQFLEGVDQRERMADDDYRSQLLDCYEQFMAQQTTAHRGILEVRVSNAKTDTIQKITNVFLVLCYGDSTNEEIVVPMVERNGS